MAAHEDPSPSPRPPAERRAVLRAGLVPAGAIVVASFLQAEVRHGSWSRLNGLLCIVEPTRSNMCDALPAMDAARALVEGGSPPIYDMSRPDAAAFLYPPIAAALYVPHVLRGELSAGSLVSWNRLVFLLIAIVLAAALVGPRRRWPSLGEACAAALALVLFAPALSALELNQASLHVALFLGAAWVALDRGAERTAGVFLALAAAVKPHLFGVAPLLFFHARRAALATAVSGVALLAASIGFAGVSNHVTYVTQVLPVAARGYAFAPNQSIGGLLHRWLSDAPLGVFELMAPDPFVMRATAVLGAALYGVTLLSLWRARHRKDLAREAFASAWLVTTLIAPIAWGHHYIALLFPLAWLVGRARDGGERDASRLLPVAVGCALLGSHFVVTGLQGPGPRLLASYGLFGAFLALFALARPLLHAGRALGSAADTGAGVGEETVAR